MNRVNGNKRIALNVCVGVFMAVLLVMTNIFGMIGGKQVSADTSYSLVFDPGECGTGTMASQTVTNGEYYTFPSCTFTSSVQNKDFDHWTMSGVDGIFYPGDHVAVWNNCATNGTVIVTAHWRASGAAAVSSGSSVLKPQQTVDCMKEVREKIKLVALLGGPRTVYIKGITALSRDVLELLSDNPQITLVSEFTYEGVDFKLTIPGSGVIVDPNTDWYGPKCLYPSYYIYGHDTTPGLSEYLDKFS